MPLYNLCYRVLGNPHDAEEAAQEAFLHAFTRLGSYDPARPFKTWLFAIAHHYCIDRLRRRRLTWLSLDDEPALDTPWRSAAPTPEETATRHERDDDIQALLASLPPKDRSPVVMRYWYDLSYEEIAAATMTTVSAGKKPPASRATLALAPLVKPTEKRPARDDALATQAGAGASAPPSDAASANITK